MNRPEIIINLWHLKNTNGMFFYAKDYMNDLSVNKCIVIRQGSNVEKHCLLDSKYERIITLNGFQYLLFMLKAAFNETWVFTPTSHPIPFINKQLIVVHDTYPFTGMKGRFKKILFLTSCLLSKCKIGYINNSRVKKELLGFGFPLEKLMFTPNKFPVLDTNFIHSPNFDDSGRITLGLVGTDSDKKNYHQLFSVINNYKLKEKFVFHIYGHNTEYFQQLIAGFPDIRVVLVNSNDKSIESYLQEIHCLISVCTDEGFGRPIATALINHIPCLLLNCAVFKEFYSSSAYFFESIEQLVTFSDNIKLPLTCVSSYVPPEDAVDSYSKTIDFLKQKVHRKGF